MFTTTSRRSRSPSPPPMPSPELRPLALPPPTPRTSRARRHSRAVLQLNIHDFGASLKSRSARSTPEPLSPITNAPYKPRHRRTISIHQSADSRGRSPPPSHRARSTSPPPPVPPLPAYLTVRSTPSTPSRGEMPCWPAKIVIPPLEL